MENNITVHEATNRGNNLLVVGLLSFTAIGLLGEIIRETELRDKGDDIFIVLLALASIIWYFTGRNRYKLSWFPFILLAATAIVKAATLIYEFSDQVAVGDELGLALPLVVMTIVTGIAIARTHRNQLHMVTPQASEMMHSGD
jgi:hypothetical protein